MEAQQARATRKGRRRGGIRGRGHGGLTVSALAAGFAVVLGLATLALPGAPASAQLGGQGGLAGPQGQEDPQTQAVLEAAPQVELDVGALVRGDSPLMEQLGGPVWQIEAREGRRLLYLSLRLEPGAGEAVELSSPPIDVRGGYFIAWHIPRPGEAEGPERGQRGQRGRPRGPGEAPPEPDPFGPGMEPGRDGQGGPRPDAPQPPWMRHDAPAGPPEFEPPAGQRGAAQREPAPPDAAEGLADMAETVDAEALTFPEGAPQFARRLGVRADGYVQWGIDRNIRDGEVRSGTDPWLLKVRPNRIRELVPEPPDVRRQRGEDSATYNRRRAQAMREYRDQRQAAVAFQREVRELPDEFERPIPPRIGAVYAIMDGRAELELRGEAADLPWSIARSDLAMLHQFAGRSFQRRGDGLGGDVLEDIQRMSGMVASGHPLTARAVAYALHEAGAMAGMQPNDPVHQLVRALVQSPDDEAVQRVLRDLAMAEAPGSATLRLLRSAADRMDNATRLAALAGMIRAGHTAEQQQERFHALGLGLEMANELLIDADGPPPEDVLERILRGLEPESELLVAATHGVDFAPMPEGRLDHAIALVIRRAGMHPLAANWLNHRLLDPADPSLVHRTLELLNDADTGVSPMGPVVHTMFDLVFDRRDATADGEAAQARRPLDLHVEVLAPLDSDNHSLFRSLNSGDPEVYELAWAALPIFQIPQHDRAGGMRRSGQHEPDEQDVARLYRQVVDAALGRSSVPPEVVRFLERQPHANLATRGLVRVALASDDAVAVDAVRALYASQQPLGEVLTGLGREDRADFAAAAYRALSGNVPRVVGLMRDPSDRSEVVQWFGDRLAQGRLPAPGEWAEAYPDEEALLELVAMSGEPALAEAAVAGLVTAAGGDSDTVDELVRRLTADSDRSPEELHDAWRSSKRRIHAERLADSAGDYRLIVQPPAGEDTLGMPAPIVLGVVELVTGDDAAYLGRNQSVTLAIPDDHFAIRIEQPNDLKNFPSSEIADLPLREIDGPLDLLPQHDGSWRGDAEMGFHGWIEVRLEPAG